VCCSSGESVFSEGIVPLTSVETVKSAPPVMKVYPLRSAVVVSSVPFKPTVVHLTSVTFVKSVNWPSEESVYLMTVVPLTRVVLITSVVPCEERSSCDQC